MAHVLIVEDDANSAEMLATIVAAEGLSHATARTLREARLQLARQRPQVVLLDLHLPDGNGLDLFPQIGEGGDIAVVLITGHASVETSVQALRVGAADYLTKPLNVPQLRRVLSRAVQVDDPRGEIGELRRDIEQTGRFGHLWGRSQPMRSVYDWISRVAPTAVSVLIVGESGTGKELVAHTVHDLSRRRGQPFLAVNCGAISPQLIESELFGHEKGSFTGAMRQHRGYFERAQGGTLFLDEITEMPAESQVKLLRVLETGAFMRIGSDELNATDVRILAATNRNPAEAVSNGKLRADLYYRLNVFRIPLPPLRERLEDIELLAPYFLQCLAGPGETPKRFTTRALRQLQQYHWPGNVRELRNVVQRAAILADGGTIDQVALPDEDDRPLPPAGPARGEPVTPGPSQAPAGRAMAPAAGNGMMVTIPVGTSIAQAERELIYATLKHCGGVKERTADVLGISLKTLYNRLREYEHRSP